MSIHDIHSMRNRQQIAFIFIGIALAAFAAVLATENLIFALIYVPALPFIIFPLVAMPHKITFDEEGLTMHYIFVKNERYLWSNIESIEAEFHGNGRYMYVPYEKEPREEKHLKQYKFPKRRKSEVAISLYYTGKIEDEQRDGVPWH